MKKNIQIKVERYRLKELPADEEKNLNRETLEQEIRELDESDREILNRYAPSDMAAQIRKKRNGNAPEETGETGREIPFRKTGLKIKPAVLIPVAATLLFGLLLPFMLPRKDAPGTEQEITRMKGYAEPVLKIYRKSGSTSETLDESSRAREMDLLQLGYRVNEPAYGIILSVDGRGIVTRHLPEEEDLAPRLSTGGEQLLPFSYELDDAPEYETFYLITSDRSFPIDTVMDAVASAARENGMVLDIPEIIRNSGVNSRESGNMDQYAVPIRKED